MKKRSNEELLHILLIVGIALIVLALLILFVRSGALALMTVIRYCGVLLSPFLVAWTFSVVMRPLVTFLHKKLRLPNTLAVLLSLLFLIGILALVLWMLTMVLLNVLGTLSQGILSHGTESVLENLFASLESFAANLQLNLSITSSTIDQWQTQVASWAKIAMDQVVSIAKGTPGAFIWILVALVSTFYLCREEVYIRNFMISLLPKKMWERARRTYDDTSNILGGYIRGLLLVVLITAIICIIGLTVLGAERAIALGFFAGFLDLIPVLGPGTMLIPWSIWSLLDGRLHFGIGLLILWVLAASIRYVVEPKIIGDRVGLHPLATLAAIFVGMKLFGVVGLILGPIFLAVAISVIRASRQSTRMEKQWGQEEAREQSLRQRQGD